MQAVHEFTKRLNAWVESWGRHSEHSQWMQNLMICWYHLVIRQFSHNGRFSLNIFSLYAKIDEWFCYIKCLIVFQQQRSYKFCSANKLMTKYWINIEKFTMKCQAAIWYSLFLHNSRISVHTSLNARKWLGVVTYLLLKSYSKYKIDRDRNLTHDTDINIKDKSYKHFKTCKSMHMQHTVHETHIPKIMSFISSRVNHPGIIRKLSLTIIISRSRSATATWWLSVEVLTDNLMTSFIRLSVIY